MINLPGVAYDKEQLTEVLKKYKKFIYNSSENVLEDLKKIIEKCKQEEFERVHFHFSGKYRKIIGSIRSPRCHNVWRLGQGLYSKTQLKHFKDNPSCIFVWVISLNMVFFHLKWGFQAKTAKSFENGLTLNFYPIWKPHSPFIKNDTSYVLVKHISEEPRPPLETLWRNFPWAFTFENQGCRERGADLYISRVYSQESSS